MSGSQVWDQIKLESESPPKSKRVNGGPLISGSLGSRGYQGSFWGQELFLGSASRADGSPDNLRTLALTCEAQTESSARDGHPGETLYVLGTVSPDAEYRCQKMDRRKCIEELFCSV